MVFLMWDHHWWLSPSEIRGVIRFNHQQPWIEGRISTISAGYPTDGSKKREGEWHTDFAYLRSFKIADQTK